MADRMVVLRGGEIVQLGQPAELYRRPRTRFVADFLGETNFLAAKVIGREGGRIVLESAVGRLAAHVEGGEGELGDALGTDREVTLSIRPEAIRILAPSAAASTGGNFLRGRRTGSTYLGDAAQHTIAVNGATQLRINETNPRSPLDEHVVLQIEPEDVVIVADDID